MPLHVSVQDTDDFDPALYHPIIDDVFLEMCDRKEPYALKPSPFGLVQGAHGGHRGEGCKGLLYGFIDLVCCHPVVPSDVDHRVMRSLSAAGVIRMVGITYGLFS